MRSDVARLEERRLSRVLLVHRGQRHIRTPFSPLLLAHHQSLTPYPQTHNNHQSHHPTTARMHFPTTLLALFLSTSLSSAASLRRQSGICGPLSTPLCCQLDVEGVANLNCENGTSCIDNGRVIRADEATAGPVTSIEEFEATCAATGTSAQCCVLALGADGLVCTGA
jgi:hypothetical protein